MTIPNEPRPASVAELGGLHEALTTEFRDRLRYGEETMTKDGEVVRVRPTPATLQAIRQFLKDNGINAVPGRGGPIDKLTQDALNADLPEYEE